MQTISCNSKTFCIVMSVETLSTIHIVVGNISSWYSMLFLILDTSRDPWLRFTVIANYLWSIVIKIVTKIRLSNHLPTLLSFYFKANVSLKWEPPQNSFQFAVAFVFADQSSRFKFHFRNSNCLFLFVVCF